MLPQRAARYWKTRRENGDQAKTALHSYTIGHRMRCGR